MFADITNRVHQTPLRKDIHPKQHDSTPQDPASILKSKFAAKIQAQSAFGEHIKVVLRIRPFTSLEKKEHGIVPVISVMDENETVSTMVRLVPPEGSHARKMEKEAVEYKFSSVYDETFSQESVYEGCALPLVKALFTQQSSLLFVYGVSNSGKTFTICGPRDMPGIVPLALRDVFDRIKEMNNEMFSYYVKVSFFEFYDKKEVFDLLTDEDRAPKPVSTKIKNPPKRGRKLDVSSINSQLSFSNLTEYEVLSAEDACILFEEGQLRKHMESTGMNSTSSRSHAIFNIKLFRKSRKDYSTECSVLSVVDLAGIERTKKAALEGGASDKQLIEREAKRKTEAAFINQSLMALGALFRMFSESMSNASKLSSSNFPSNLRESYFNAFIYQMMSQCAGRIVMITNVSPGPIDYDEKIRVLEYASIAKRVVMPAVATPCVPSQRKRRLTVGSSIGSTPRSATSMKRRTPIVEDYSSWEMNFTFEDALSKISELQNTVNALDRCSKLNRAPDTIMEEHTDSSTPLKKDLSYTISDTITPRIQRVASDSCIMSPSILAASANLAKLTEVVDSHVQEQFHTPGVSGVWKLNVTPSPSKISCYDEDCNIISRKNNSNSPGVVSPGSQPISLQFTPKLTTPGSSNLNSIPEHYQGSFLPERLHYLLDLNSDEDQKLHDAIYELHIKGQSDTLFQVLEHMKNDKLQERFVCRLDAILSRMMALLNKSFSSRLASSFYNWRSMIKEANWDDQKQALNEVVPLQNALHRGGELLYQILKRVHVRDKLHYALKLFQRNVVSYHDSDYKRSLAIAQVNLADSETKISNLQFEISNMRTNNEELASSFKLKQLDLEKLMESSRNLSLDLCTALAGNQSLELTNSQSQLEINRLISIVTSLKHLLCLNDAQKKRLFEIGEVQDSELNKINSKLEAMKLLTNDQKNLHEMELHKIEKLLQQRNEVILSLETSISELKFSSEMLQSSFKLQLDSLNSQLLASSLNNEKLTATLSDLELEFNNCSAAKSSAEEKVSELLLTVSTTTSSMVKLQAENELTLGKLEELQMKHCSDTMSFSNRIASLSSEIQVLSQKLVDQSLKFEHEKEKIQSKYAVLEASERKTQEMLIESTSLLNSTKSELLVIQQSYIETLNMLSTSKETNNDLELNLKMVQEKLVQSQQMESDLLLESSNLKVKLEELYTAGESTKLLSENRLSESMNLMQSRIDDLNFAHKKLQESQSDEIEKLKSFIQSLTIQNGELLSQQFMLHASLYSNMCVIDSQYSENQYNFTLKKVLEAKISSMESELLSCKETLDHSENNLVNALQSKEQLLSESSHDKEQYEAVINSRNAEIEELKMCISDTKSKMSLLQEAFDVSQLCLHRFAFELENSRDNLEKQKVTNKEIAYRLVILQIALYKAKRDSELKRSEIVAVQSEYSQCKLNYQAAISVAESTCTILKAKLEEKEIACINLEKKVKFLDQALVDSENTVATKINENTKLLEMIEALEKHLAYSKVKELEMSALLHQKENDLKVQIAEIVQLHSSLDTKRTELSLITEITASDKLTMEHLSSQILTLNAIKSKLEEELRITHISNSNLLEKVRSIEIELETLRVEYGNAVVELKNQASKSQNDLNEKYSELLTAHVSFQEVTKLQSAEISQKHAEELVILESNLKAEFATTNLNLSNSANQLRVDMEEKLHFLQESHIKLQSDMTNQIETLRITIDSLNSEKIEREAILVTTQWQLQRRTDELALLVQDKHVLEESLFSAQEARDKISSDFENQKNWMKCAMEYYESQFQCLKKNRDYDLACKGDSFERLFGMTQTCRKLRQQISVSTVQTEAEEKRLKQMIAMLEDQEKHAKLLIDEKENLLSLQFSRIDDLNSQMLVQSGEILQLSSKLDTANTTLEQIKSFSDVLCSEKCKLQNITEELRREKLELEDSIVENDLSHRKYVSNLVKTSKEELKSQADEFESKLALTAFEFEALERKLQLSYQDGVSLKNVLQKERDVWDKASCESKEQIDNMTQALQIVSNERDMLKLKLDFEQSQANDLKSKSENDIDNIRKQFSKYMECKENEIVSKEKAWIEKNFALETRLAEQEEYAHNELQKLKLRENELSSLLESKNELLILITKSIKTKFGFISSESQFETLASSLEFDPVLVDLHSSIFLLLQEKELLENEKVRLLQEIQVEIPNRNSAAQRLLIENYEAQIACHKEQVQKIEANLTFKHANNLTELQKELSQLKIDRTMTLNEKEVLTKEAERRVTELEIQLHEKNFELKEARKDCEVAVKQITECCAMLNSHLGLSPLKETTIIRHDITEEIKHQEGQVLPSEDALLQNNACSENEISDNACEIATRKRSSTTGCRSARSSFGPFRHHSIGGEVGHYESIDSLVQRLSLQDTLKLAAKKITVMTNAPTVPEELSYLWFQSMSERPSWQPDESREDCTICLDKFGIFRRRHHCRMCGFIFCNDCSLKTMIIPFIGSDSKERVCDLCAVKIRFHTATERKARHILAK